MASNNANNRKDSPAPSYQVEDVMPGTSYLTEYLADQRATEDLYAKSEQDYNPSDPHTNAREYMQSDHFIPGLSWRQYSERYGPPTTEPSTQPSTSR